MERLMDRTSINIGNPVSNVNNYREQIQYDSDDESCHSTEDDADSEHESDTAVFYNLVD